MTVPVPVQRILVGVDLEESTAAAVSAAGAVAAAFGAQLIALHAHRIEMPAYFTEAQLQGLERERRQAHAKAVAELRAFAGRHTTVPLLARVEEGTPADVLLRAAPAFDLVVLGTRRLYGARRWWMGSVAEAVVRASPAPVLVVPAGASAEPLLDAGAPVVAVGAPTGNLEGWLAALGAVRRGGVLRAGEAARCTSDTLSGAGLVVLALPAAAGPEHDAVAKVLKECSHPVLFVPAGRPVPERSRS
jgi:nucleotide-binding universal stress UspA family protein